MVQEDGRFVDAVGWKTCGFQDRQCRPVGLVLANWQGRRVGASLEEVQ